MKSDHRLAACLAFLSLLASGCSFAPRKPFDPAPSRSDSAALYFYRPSEMTARLIRPTISANGAQLGKLANDSYGVAYLPPGEVQLRSVWPGIPGSVRDDSVSVRVEAGRNYYLRVRYHTGKPRGLTPGVAGLGGLSFEDRVGLEEVPEKEAVPQLAGLELCDAFQPAGGDSPTKGGK